MKGARLKRPILLVALMALALPARGLEATPAGIPGGGADLLPVEQEPRRVKGDLRVNRDEIIRDDIIVDRGTLTVDGEVRGWVVVAYGDAIIRGTVEGHVISLYGDVTVMNNGLIQGDAVSIEGDVVIRDSGVVTGSNVTTTVEGLRRQGWDVSWARIVREARVMDRGEERERDQWERDRRSELYDRSQSRMWRSYDFLYTGNFPLGWLAYNRVDGLTIQGEIFNSQHEWGGAATSFYGGLGYAFRSKEKGRLYYRMGLNRYWLPRSPIEIGAGLYKQLETEDTWYMTPRENTFHAMLINYDWYDYYLLEGYGGYLRFTPDRWLKVGARYVQEEELATEKVTDWAVFGGNRSFRKNEWLTTYDPDPFNTVYSLADEGDLRRLIYFVHVDVTSWGRRRPGQGFLIDASMEQVDHKGSANIGDGGAFAYERIIAELKSYLSLSRIDHIAMRVRMGTSKADEGYAIPIQHLYYLGGIGSLRGYEFKQFSGDRLFLATAEYTLGANGWSPFFDDWALTLFFDYGLAWYTQEDGLYSDLVPEDPMRSVGVALAPFGWEGFRVEVAKPLDGEVKDLTWYFRLSFGRPLKW